MNLKNNVKDILKENIGVAGCGNMGSPMLHSILSKNVHAEGYDIENKQSLLAKNFVFSQEKFLNDNNVIISVVRDAADTTELCQGNAGLFEQNSKKILIISSTLSPRFLMDLKNMKIN